jgi:hypothetical protein
MVEYALVTSLFLLAIIALLPWFQQQISDYLIDTGDSIGQPRTTPDPAFAAVPPPPPNWEIFNPVLGPELTVNGSFEDPVMACASPCFEYATVPGWTTTDTSSGPNTAELWNTGFGPNAWDGNQVAELNVESAAEYTQIVNVTPGRLHVWKVVHKARVDRGESAEVLIDGNVVATLVGDERFWQTHEGTYVATGPTIEITLRSVPGTYAAVNQGNLIDGVSIREYSL